jgi:hypothetical protein
MNHKSKTRVTPSSTISVGEKGYLRFGNEKRLVRIIEDRGNIGQNGRRLLRVEYAGRFGRGQESFEIPAEEIFGRRKKGTRRATKSKVNPAR